MEDILDEQPEIRPPAPHWWPSVVMGGLCGAALVIVFNFITSNGGPIAIIYLIVTFIVLNSTMNHYRSKPYSNQSFPMAFAMCLGTYTIMMVTSGVVMALWLHCTSYNFSVSMDNPLNSIVMLVGGGLLVSAVSAFLSKRYRQS